MNQRTTVAVGCVVLLFAAFSRAPHAAADAPNQAAQAVVDEAARLGGLIVEIGLGDGRLTAALRASEQVVVHALDRDADHVAAARRRLTARGLYGPIAVDQWQGDRLPYADDLARMVVVHQGAGVARREVLRVLAPEGVAWLEQDGRWERLVKPWPTDIDQWTHYLHDASGNAVAADRRVGPPRRVRWIADPIWGRTHEMNPSLNALVTGGGRLFYLQDDGLIGLADLRLPDRWSLYARDAWSGKLLWKRPVPHWGWRQWNTRGMWSAPLTLNRRLVTDGQRVYVTLGYKAPVSVLDAATGRTLRTLADTDGTDEMILHDGVLLLAVREHLSVASPPKVPPKRRRNPHEWTIDAPGPAAIVAIEAATGRQLWRLDPQPVTVLTLAALGDSICFYGDGGIVCLDLATGRRRWFAPCRAQRGSRFAGGTLVMHDDVVLMTSADGLVAFDLTDGKRLWQGPKVSGPGISHPPDLFVISGLVWSGHVAGTYRRDQTEVTRQGFDLRTGQVRRTIEVANLFSPLHHVRCYRSKATERYLLLPKRGIEFLDLQGQNHSRNDWVRAMCHYGVMPANGLLYVPPHYCFCYPGVRVNGFLALAAQPDSAATAQSSLAQRLQRGPAFGEKVEPAGADSSDWPTYRHDPLRSGHTPMAVGNALQKQWEIDVGGRITQPVVAGGRLFAAAIDAHRIECRDPASGRLQWSFVAGGRIDSPPTVYRGRVLFGSHDGWVWCLRADDGRLIWRFRAAPRERRIVVREQVESAWPVPGNVLVLDNVAYVVAGRSSFLDGGVYLYGLAPDTGRLLYQQHVSGPWPDVEKDKGRPFDMDGTLADILVTDGRHLFLYQMVFDKQLRDVTPPRASTLGDRITGRHLVATGGFLEGCWFDRTYWWYANRWPGFYYANAAPKTGQILVFDEQTTYALHVFTERLRLSPAFTPADKGYALVADDNDNEPVLTPKSIDREKGPGFSRAAPPKWSRQIPLRALAMVLAGDRLVLAGPPDQLPPDDPYAALDGRLGGELWVVSAEDGRKLSGQKLDSLPAHDGLIAAAGRVYLATADGRLICFSGDKDSGDGTSQ